MDSTSRKNDSQISKVLAVALFTVAIIPSLLTTGVAAEAKKDKKQQAQSAKTPQQRKTPAPAKPAKTQVKPTAAPEAKPVSQSTPAPTAAPGSSATSSMDSALFGGSFSDAPTTISSDSLTLHSKDRVFVYKGNVNVTQGDMTLTSKTLEGTYSEQNRIERLVAKGDVLITKQDIRATSQQALYDAATATVVLTDNPQLQQQDSVLTADKIRVFLNENRSQAEGTVRVTLVNKKGGGSNPFGMLKPTPAPTGKPADASAPAAPNGSAPAAR